ncbi:YiiD C-terminal domain-containing protein [Sinimarinibacterium sp. NLF-5-8]|uniref:YiiD C-terminal domain-containing protein n=1 Tax=Sinimarinibacterium sp. NLF-5-8 TaxID=2698684 RepID=UPI00137B9BCA|nr:YiiD C-terminal domain-containing protein [Sinimarinibacterium sp. NLF-5-8]QHS10586.1 hypothetical protein GT972_10885 [Sinimarinibacterium sp. NLF-5-8]
MSPSELEAFLTHGIPLTRALGVDVEHVSTHHLRIRAPLAPNLNHHGSAFGGSLATLGIVTGWSLLHNALTDAAIAADVVVRKVELDYQRPVLATLVADARVDDAALQAFLSLARARQKARLTLEVAVSEHGCDAAALHVRAHYVALPPPEKTAPQREP